MKKISFQSGFTLIELLVVIAIIGILAAVVIGSLNDARSGGQNASIKQSVATVRTQAELHYNANGFSYAAVCDDPRILQLLTAALRVSVPAGSYTAAGTDTDVQTATTAVCRDQATSFSAAVPLIGTPQVYWCVDSTGASEQISAPLGATAATVCP